MLFSAACFAAMVLLVRAVSSGRHANVWLVSATRFGTGVVILVAFFWRETQFRRVFTRAKLAGRGVVGGIGVTAYYLTVAHLGAGRATFINNTYVIFGAIFAVWVLHERFRALLGIGCAAALVGLALLTDAFAAGFHTSIYDAIAVLTALGSAYIVITIRLLHRDGEHTTTIFAAQCVYGALICVVPTAMTGFSVDGRTWGLMLAAGALAAIGQLAMTRAFRDVSVGEGSLIQILVPLGIAVGGVVFFHEHFSPHEIIGAGLIIGGTLLATPFAARKRDG